MSFSVIQSEHARSKMITIISSRMINGMLKVLSCPGRPGTDVG
jgi:hypothetical protein